MDSYNYLSLIFLHGASRICIQITITLNYRKNKIFKKGRIHFIDYISGKYTVLDKRNKTPFNKIKSRLIEVAKYIKRLNLNLIEFLGLLKEIKLSLIHTMIKKMLMDQLLHHPACINQSFMMQWQGKGNLTSPVKGAVPV